MALTLLPGEAVGSQPVDCPARIAAIARCSVTTHSSGAQLLWAIPARSNGSLIVHAHGGPRLDVRLKDSVEDLDRFAGFVEAGYSWIGSTYRRGGYGVRMAASDVDDSRAAFWARYGRPQLTLLHGQSYGANVAAKVAEMHALGPEGDRHYDGVLLTNGILSGGVRAYQFRADLRAVYQYYCRNHPHPSEPQYPLWSGLPPASPLTRDELRRRVNACTGVDADPARRSTEQSFRLRQILAVSGVAESQLVGHLAWATFMFRDLAQRLGGESPFQNIDRVYSGSDDDGALNRGVLRFSASPRAQALLGYDSDLSGNIVLPTITLNAIGDPVVAPSNAADYAKTVAASNRGHLLLSLYSDESDHSRLSGPALLASLASLHAWAQGGVRPAESEVVERCVGMVGRGSERCRLAVGRLNREHERTTRP